MSRTRQTIVAAATLVVMVGGYRALHGHAAAPRFHTEVVTTGDVVRRVAATGTLQALKTVEVGSQVSGTIKDLGADFNSIVRKGQVLARLDPSLIDAQVESARSALAKSRADADASRVALGDAEQKLTRAQALHARQLIADSDLDDATIAVKTAKADLESKESQVVQAQASLDQALVNRQYTVIRAPIDGIVVARNVDVGQTVAASFQAPTLFVLAADLTRMQLEASIDESDVGQVRTGQTVKFQVDAYPQDEFLGVVTQIRLQPVTVSNVVTYNTEIAVDNADLRLKPGMTGTLNIEVARDPGVLRVPASALRWVPTPEIFSRLGQPDSAEAAAERRHRPTTTPGSRAVVWTLNDSRLQPQPVTLGLSDGAMVEVSGPGLQQGEPVVTGEIVASAGPMAGTPLMPGAPTRR